MVLITVYPDSMQNTDKVIVLKMEVKKDNNTDTTTNNTGNRKEFVITVKTVHPSGLTADNPAPYSFSFIDTKPVTRSKTDDVIYPIYLKANTGSYKDSTGYKVSVTADPGHTTLTVNDYKIDPSEKNFTAINNTDSSANAFYVTVKKDSMEDRTRTLALKIEVKKNEQVMNASKNTGTNKNLNLVINGIKANDTLKGYNYLAYLGTNFDLVDGSKARNFFFATNIFLAPEKKNSVGFYLSFYGNRTMTSTDTTSNVIRTTRIAAVTDSKTSI